jgi:hypothetical protein
MNSSVYDLFGLKKEESYMSPLHNTTLGYTPIHYPLATYTPIVETHPLSSSYSFTNGSTRYGFQLFNENISNRWAINVGSEYKYDALGRTWKEINSFNSTTLYSTEPVYTTPINTFTTNAKEHEFAKFNTNVKNPVNTWEKHLDISGTESVYSRPLDIPFGDKLYSKEGIFKHTIHVIDQPFLGKTVCTENTPSGIVQMENCDLSKYTKEKSKPLHPNKLQCRLNDYKSNYNLLHNNCQDQTKRMYGLDDIDE